MDEKYAELRQAVEAAELVDAHAHNIITHASTIPFLSCFSEASGKALSFVPSTLNFKRSLRDIAKLYSTELSLEAIKNCRSVSGIATLSNTCFEAAKISAVLIDDAIELENMIATWELKYIVPFVGRILRIERLAEQILDEGIKNGKSWTLDTFTDTFIGRLTSFSVKVDKWRIVNVVALKSIAAYRSGLDINPNVTKKEAEEALAQVLVAGNPVRITNTIFIDYIFVRSLEVALRFDWLMQIHTGFGDKDLDLRQANPLHLRNLLEDPRFLDSRIVYLDFGLAIPKLSVHGMISTMKQLLELAPIKKVMFSTDGCAFPETFYLGAKWAREFVFSVLRDACNEGDLSIPEALEAVTDIFSANSKKFYKLHVK